MYGSTAIQVRLALYAVDRGLDLNLKLMVSRRSDEPMKHVVLRILAFCLFTRDDPTAGLRFAPGPADRDAPDLWAHDLVGRAIEWIVCDPVDAEELRHVLQHQRQAKVRVLFGSDESRREFVREVRSLRRRVPGLEVTDFRQVDSQVLDLLAQCDLERQRWAVTLVEDHLYVDAEGVSADSEVKRPDIMTEVDAR